MPFTIGELTLFFISKLNLTNQKTRFSVCIIGNVFWICPILLLYDVTDRKRGDSVILRNV